MIKKNNVFKYIFFLIPTVLTFFITIAIKIYQIHSGINEKFSELVFGTISIYFLIVIFELILGTFLAILEKLFKGNKIQKIIMFIAITILGLVYFIVKK